MLIRVIQGLIQAITNALFIYALLWVPFRWKRQRTRYAKMFRELADRLDAYQGTSTRNVIAFLVTLVVFVALSTSFH